jgi:ribonucleoside-diphosphate reductase alpha chain
MHLTRNARKLLEARYLKDGETPEEMFERVARAVSAAEENQEEWEEKFFVMMSSLRFLPNSPTLMNAERPLGMLSACFVLPVLDSIEGIFDGIKNAALVQRAGGGTGFNFSRLRPRGSVVRSSGGQTTGPCEFIKVFSQATTAIQQGAFRRGANMGVMEITHPDILEFINIKNDLTALQNFNLSVGVTDEFMRRLKETPKDTVETHHRQVGKGTLGRKWTYDKLWHTIIESAWRTGEPGVLFLDTINKDNPTPSLGRLDGVNPCAEQPLLPYEACNLGSLNLSKFVKNHNIQWDLLGETVRIAVRFLDDVITVNRYPLPKIRRRCEQTRKVGLGVMGFADFLTRLGVPYNSEAAVYNARVIMKFIQETAWDESEKLAREKGECPAPDVKGRRNASLTTIAPTGSLSIIANCSGGIEPLFNVVFNRNVIDSTLPECNYLFKKALKARGIYSEDLLRQISVRGSLQEIIGLPTDLKELFQVSRDVPPEQHLKIQAAFQEHTDAAVSKTVNMDASATIEHVKKTLESAHELRLKGVTIYRDECRENQPMQRMKCEDGACSL